MDIHPPQISELLRISWRDFLCRVITSLLRCFTASSRRNTALRSRENPKRKHYLDDTRPKFSSQCRLPVTS
jgi:hypothetical protein